MYERSSRVILRKKALPSRCQGGLPFALFALVSAAGSGETEAQVKPSFDPFAMSQQIGETARRGG